MNKWQNIWQNKRNDFEMSNDFFENYKKLKKANGFDVLVEDGYYEGLYNDFIQTFDVINEHCANISSVYEVGCGSGVNLYILQKVFNLNRLGGVDYSNSLLDIAKKVTKINDLKCMDAEKIDTSVKYDVVMADSVFQYFTSEEKGYKVLEKMYEKANKIVVIKEVHDKKMKEEHLEYRRKMIENYDEKYKDLEKTFYDRKVLENFAEKRGCEVHILKPQSDKYWNNAFVFDYYLVKK